MKIEDLVKAHGKVWRSISWVNLTVIAESGISREFKYVPTVPHNTEYTSIHGTIMFYDKSWLSCRGTEVDYIVPPKSPNSSKYSVPLELIDFIYQLPQPCVSSIVDPEDNMITAKFKDSTTVLSINLDSFMIICKVVCARKGYAISGSTTKDGKGLAIINDSLHFESFSEVQAVIDACTHLTLKD